MHRREKNAVGGAPAIRSARGVLGDREATEKRP